ncbi:transporter [Sphaerisporangium melleum]|uniref:Transporter n=1 Tax=Sphaerisporangium melleum TaxID=321316 RepID=A0A917QSZ9_9ACTN|nr:hypothetical protein [Sphaerisporangium melleum]GGK65690.1 transporter [Sphaerisporangium melleum]GII69930.1 transporter [Sphaerisporangium melleum]
MAWLFVRLKLRLIAGNLRGDAMRQIGFVFTLIAAAAVALGGFALIALLRFAPQDVAVDAGMVIFTVIALIWVVGPLLVFGVDETLDPARLVLFPLTARQMAVGMFAASATGPWPLASLIVLLGAVAGLARDVSGLLIGLVAVPLHLAFCLVASRTVTTALSRLLRSRRGRDLLAIGVVFVVLLSQVPNLVINRGVAGPPLELLAGLAALVRWSPPGMAAHAIAGGGLLGLAELAAVGVLVIVLAAVWVAVLRRTLVRADSSTEAASVGRSRFDRLLPGGPFGAVVAKELKYLRREPRGRMGWLSAVGVSTVLLFSLSSGPGGLSGASLAIAVACLTALMLGLQGVNVFGIDGRALWMNAVVYSAPRDLRTDLAARHLAISLAAGPAIAVLAVAGALVAGDLVWAVPALLTAAGALPIALGVGAVTSVITPYTYPQRVNAFTSAAPGQGGVAVAGSFGAMLATALLAAPVVIPVLMGVTWLSVVAVPYGLAVAYGGRRLAATIGYARLPDLLAAVSRPS